MSALGHAPADQEGPPDQFPESRLVDVRRLPISELIGDDRGPLSNALRRLMAGYTDGVVAGFANRPVDASPEVPDVV